MSLNQQLREPRVLAFLTPRLIALMTFMAAALLVAGCASSPPPPVQESHSPSAAITAPDTDTSAADLTATEAAVAALNEAPVAEATQPTAQLIRPDAPMNYTVKRGDTLWDIAAVFLKHPWFWPEIWQINPQVENPHLIFPGDTLTLVYNDNGRPAVTVTERGPVTSGGGVDRLSPRVRELPLENAIPAIPYASVQAFLSRSVVLEKKDLAH